MPDTDERGAPAAAETAAPSFQAALVQFCATRNLDHNVDLVSGLIRTAAAGGAEYIQTPEVTTLMEMQRDALFAATPLESENHVERHFADLAKSLRIWLHIGSMGVRVPGEKIANRAFLFTPDGDLVATYDKIHMFDIDLKDGERYRESRNYRPGEEAVVADLPWGRLGITICYDLRFPVLYEQLAIAGSKFIAVPSAFTVPTGKAHWHSLLRARAIETQCFVFAAAQAGAHECGRLTYGHSMIVAPWGEVLAEGGESAPQIVSAKIELERLQMARQRVPALMHRRSFKEPRTPEKHGCAIEETTESIESAA